ncbi:MAG: fibronectin type III domain-containing protein, partial [Chitinivibrionales bacterium]
LKWYGVSSGTNTYRIEYATNQDYTENLTTIDTQTTGAGLFTKPITGLKGNAKYYWHVRKTNIVGTGTWSDSNFTTQQVTPPKVTLYSPANGATAYLQAKFTWVSWYITGGGDKYRLNYSIDSNFTQKTTIDSIDGLGSLTIRTFCIQGLLANTKYFWRVMAFNSYSGSWSDRRSFTTSPYTSITPTVQYLLDDK